MLMDVDPPTFKILLVGGPCSGKTSFVGRLKGLPPLKCYVPSVGVEEYFYIEMEIDRRAFTLKIVVIPSRESDIDEMRLLFHDFDFVFVFVNLSSPTALRDASFWLDEIKLIYPSEKIALVGNNSEFKRLLFQPSLKQYVEEEGVRMTIVDGAERNTLKPFKFVKVV